MNYEFVTLDVFTDTVFGGNPLAVVFGAESLSNKAMQSIAREFNLSETTFVLPPASAENTHHVRIFTPLAELPFAGHPTIGTAVALALAEQSEQHEHTFLFEEGVGIVSVSVTTPGGSPAHGQLTVAQLPVQITDTLSQALWAQLLGIALSDLCSESTEINMWSSGTPFSFVPVANLNALGQASVDGLRWHKHLTTSQSNGAFVFTRETGNTSVDVRARMFAPSHGIPEDPATGSAVAALAGWLVNADKPTDGTHSWTIAQGVEMGRPSRLELEADIKDGAIQGVRVGGCAVPVTKGEITVP